MRQISCAWQRKCGVRTIEFCYHNGVVRERYVIATKAGLKRDPDVFLMYQIRSINNP
jgi:hypothetical protein